MGWGVFVVVMDPISLETVFLACLAGFRAAKRGRGYSASNKKLEGLGVILVV